MKNQKTDTTHDVSSLKEVVNTKIQQKLELSRENKRGLWKGIGMFGMVGWSVAVPTLLGVALGVWLDKHVGQSFSWTLNGLIVGIILGCFIAWHWVQKESKTIHKKRLND